MKRTIRRGDFLVLVDDVTGEKTFAIHKSKLRPYPENPGVKQSRPEVPGRYKGARPGEDRRASHGISGS